MEVLHRLSAEEIAKYQQAFSLFDKDGNGKVNAKELGVVMRSLGQRLTEEELEGMIKEADTDGSGTVDFNEFIGLMALKKLSREEEEELKAAFRVFDKNDDGHISAEELRRVMHNLSQKLSDKEVAEMMKEADVDNSGGIDYHEFVNVIMSKRPLRSLESKSKSHSQKDARKSKKQCKSKYYFREHCTTL